MLVSTDIRQWQTEIFLPFFQMLRRDPPFAQDLHSHLKWVILSINPYGRTIVTEKETETGMARRKESEIYETRKDKNVFAM
jgi:hypothetical protein